MAKNLISGPILARLAQIWVPNFFSWVFPLLDIRHCCKLSLYAATRTTNNWNSTKSRKTSFWASLRPLIFLLKNMASSVTRYQGHPPIIMCNIRKKTNDPNLRKFSDRWTDGQTNNQKDVSDFIGRCSTNAERPKYIKKQFHVVWISSFTDWKRIKMV